MAEIIGSPILSKSHLPQHGVSIHAIENILVGSASSSSVKFMELERGAWMLILF